MGEESDFEEILGGENYRVSMDAWPNYFKDQDALFDSIQKRIKEAEWKRKFPINILEAGTGIGVTSIRLALLNTRTLVSSVDTSEKMRARADYVLSGLTDRVCFYHDDIVNFFKRTISQHHIFCSANTLHNFISSKRDLVIDLSYKKLINGGIFALLDLIASDDEAQYKKDYAVEMQNIARLKEQGKEDLYNYWARHYEKDRPKRIIQGELINCLKKVGFNDVRLDYRNNMYAVVTAVK